MGEIFFKHKIQTVLYSYAKNESLSLPHTYIKINSECIIDHYLCQANVSQVEHKNREPK